MSEAAQRTALYRLFDANDRLLYVGIARIPERRWRMHAFFQPPWWPLVERKTVEWHDSREAAATAELTVIRSEGPLHNKQGVSSPLILDDLEANAEALLSDGVGSKKYLRIAKVLTEAIQGGVLQPGDRLPNVAETVAYFQVGTPTVQRAHQLLKEEGLVKGRQGAGVFVADLDARMITVPVGRLAEAAALLREVLTTEARLQLAALLLED